ASATAQAEQMSTTRRYDPAVIPAAHSEPVSSPQPSGKYLAPPSANVNANGAGGSASKAEPRRVADFGVPTKSLYTMATGLPLVVGAFLLFAWALRRGGRGRAGRGMLPADAVSVLGRVSLSAKQVAQLLRVGNKLVLVALTPGGAETLTEVT